MIGSVELTKLRRLALQSQGLLKPNSFGRGLPAARKAIQHLGYVQLDSISVVERAHHHTLYSRIPNYQPVILDSLLQEKAIFEYWSHAAAFLPIEDFRFSLPYKHAIKSGQTHWYKNPDKKLMRKLIARIKSEGPLRSRDIENKTKKQSGWWDWKPAKKALEQLYMQGDLMVCDRQGFQKTYDLTERVLPSTIDTSTPNIDQYAEHLVKQQMNCHGFVSLKGFTYLRRNSALRHAVKQLVQQQVNEKQLQHLQIGDKDVFYYPTGMLDNTLPRTNKRVTILSPFDNSVIQRERLSTLFEFDYQIECYLPAAKRTYGYFCLPLLFGDDFVGRMDCKAHRDDQHLEIRALHIESNKVDFEEFLAAFAKTIKAFSKFQKCDSISVASVTPKKLAKAIRKTIKR